MDANCCGETRIPIVQKRALGNAFFAEEGTDRNDDSGDSSYLGRDDPDGCVPAGDVAGDSAAAPSPDAVFQLRQDPLPVHQFL